MIRTFTNSESMLYYCQMMEKGDYMVSTPNVLIEVLESVKKCLYDDNWKDNTLELIKEYKENLNSDDSSIIQILNTFNWYIERNRFIEARRLVDQEINNANGVTVQNCKRFKVNKGYCRVCTNYNCTNNENKVRN